MLEPGAESFDSFGQTHGQPMTFDQFFDK